MNDITAIVTSYIVIVAVVIGFSFWVLNDHNDMLTVFLEEREEQVELLLNDFEDVELVRSML